MGAIQFSVLPLLEAAERKKLFGKFILIPTCFPCRKMNIFDSLPIMAVMHGFVGIGAKSWGVVPEISFSKTA